MANVDSKSGTNFIVNAIESDLAAGKYTNGVHTRFPPEPNGYLHIGHAKSICLNFGIAQRFNGLCNLRFDDTNPSKEDVEYVDSIKDNIRWLGFDWDDRMFFASDYFQKLYDFAVRLIEKGLAYVDDSSADQIREMRGTLTEPGQNSPYRDRSIEENLDLFKRMKAGEFPDGARVLRAKIDMASPNLTMRDTVIYRIAHVNHHRTGDAWCIYPMYDFAHPLSDAIEEITHSICTLEFEDHRPFYDWLLDALDFDPNMRPRQIEFARLDLTNTVTSKRKLKALVDDKIVAGWDDPRMPTLAGMRRRGFTPAAIRSFCEEIGVAKANSLVDAAMLEHSVRDDLNKNASRRMAVLNPLKVTLSNIAEDHVEYLPSLNHPDRSDARLLPFGRTIYIEREDFALDPPKKFFRLKPGGEVRLMNAYIIKCVDVIKDDAGDPIELICEVDLESKSGSPNSNRKVKGTIHWVDATHAIPARINLYEPLFIDSEFNPNSLTVIDKALVEPSLLFEAPESKFQFVRAGYFNVDYDSTPAHLIFNRVVGLKDTWAKLNRKE